MNVRKIIASLFILIALVFGVILYLDIQYPKDVQTYFRKEFYTQFGPLAICLEMIFSAYYLYRNDKKANFYLALFASTILFDIVFNLAGLFTSSIPDLIAYVLMGCGFVSFWIAFTDSFKTGLISWKETILSIVMGVLVELFFNYL